MRYSPDDFLELDATIEEQHGVALPDPCRPSKFRLKQPRPGVEFDGSGSPGGDQMEWADFYTTGCMQDTRYALPYTYDADEVSNDAIESGAGIATVCAVDDAMGLWPRFGLDLRDSWLDGLAVPKEWTDD